MILKSEHAQAVIDLIKKNQPRLKNGYAVDSGSRHLVENYLGQNPHRILFGSFHESTLVGISTLRTFYPTRNSAIVGNFFADPGTAISVKTKLLALSELYQYACDNQINQMYSSVRAERTKRQAQVPSTLFEPIREYNTLGVLEYVPANTKPSQEWMWVIMGSRVSDVDTVIRSITRKIK